MNRTDGMKEVRVGADLRLLIDGAYTSGHLFEVSAEHHDAFVSQDVQGTGCATLAAYRKKAQPPELDVLRDKIGPRFPLLLHPSRTPYVLAAVVGFALLGAIYGAALVVTKTWPGWLPSGALIGADASTKRLVQRAVRRGQAVSETRFAPLAVAAARDVQKMKWLAWLWLGTAVVQLALLPTHIRGSVPLITIVTVALPMGLALYWAVYARRARVAERRNVGLLGGELPPET